MQEMLSKRSYARFKQKSVRTSGSCMRPNVTFQVPIMGNILQFMEAVLYTGGIVIQVVGL